MWDVAGKTVLITGSSAGIGFEAAVALARLGARILLVGRDRGRTEAAVVALRDRAEVTAEAHLCDFSSQESIREFARTIQRDHARLDVLVNNAGGIHKARSVTVDGLETTFATNHLGYFLLTNLLRDLIVRSAPARIVTVASIGHRHGTLDFDDLGYERGGYGLRKAYERSKLANVLFANELARRLEGTGVTSNSVHPGSVATDLWSDIPVWTKPLVAIALRPWFLTPEQGGAAVVQLAASPELAGVTGQYFEGGRPVAPSTLARDAALGRRLWDVSEHLVNLASSR